MKKLRKFFKVLFIILTSTTALCLVLSYAATAVSPAKLPQLAFFGLAYPVLLGLNLLFFLFWIVIWSRWVYLPLAILLIGIPVHSRFFQFTVTPGPDAEDQQTLRIMSYNVELFGWYHWKTNIQRRNKLFDQLALHPSDIYCFQEFFYTNIPGRFDTRDTLTSLLESPHFHDYYTHEMHDVQFYGIATFSKHPIINRGVIEFPNDKNNICIFSDILVDDEIFRVYNGHLCSIRFSGEEHDYANELKSDPGVWQKSKIMQMYNRLKTAFVKRAWQAELVREHMEQSPYPIIFCGDFNDPPVSYTYSVFNGFLRDTFRSRGNGTSNTYVGNFPSFRIDYIFTSPEFEHARYMVLPDELSDHKAVWSEIYY